MAVIANKTKSIMKPYKTSGDKYFYFKVLEVLYLSISYDTDDHSKLEAEIRWTNSCKKESRIFENTFQGFEQACEWLDSQRILFAERLL